MMRFPNRGTLLCAPVMLLFAWGYAEPSHALGETGPAKASLRAKVIQVGPKREIKLPSAAAAIAADGDLIEIDPGNYDGDAAVWRQNRLTIRGVGGRAHLRANGAHAEGKAIWVIKG